MIWIQPRPTNISVWGVSPVSLPSSYEPTDFEDLLPRSASEELRIEKHIAAGLGVDFGRRVGVRVRGGRDRSTYSSPRQTFGSPGNQIPDCLVPFRLREGDQAQKISEIVGLVKQPLPVLI